MTSIIPKISRLCPNVIRILGCNPSPMTLQGTNTYLIGTGKKRWLIDAGEGSVDEWNKSLESVLNDEQCQIEGLLLTHWHGDHVGGVQDVVKKHADGDCPIIYKFPRSDAAEPVCLNDLTVRQLTDGQQLNIDGANLTAVHTPGHTTDHTIFYLRDEDAVFSGDCILGEGTAVFESLFDYMKSLEKILDLHPRRIYPGHGPVIENPIEKIQYYINHRQEREAQILACLENSSSPITSMAIVQSVYESTPVNLHKAANNNVQHHLDKLQLEGKVINDNGLWRLSQ